MSAPGGFAPVSSSGPGIFGIESSSARPGTADIHLGYTQPHPWRSDMPFDQLQVAKEIMFTMPWQTGDHPEQPRLISLGQVNLVLRNAWNKLQAIRNRSRAIQGLQKGDDVLAQDAVLDADNGYIALGEEQFAEKKLMYGIYFDATEATKFLSLLGRHSIFYHFRFHGIKKTSASGTGTSTVAGDRSCTLQMGGQAVCLNYWKNPKIGDDLYLIVKREREADGRLGPYQMVPWCGRGQPSFDDRQYEDIAGNRWRGPIYQIGQITRIPNPGSASEKRRQTFVGADRNATPESVFREAQGGASVDINVHMGIEP